MGKPKALVSTEDAARTKFTDTLGKFNSNKIAVDELFRLVRKDVNYALAAINVNGGEAMKLHDEYGKSLLIEAMRHKEAARRLMNAYPELLSRSMSRERVSIAAEIVKRHPDLEDVVKKQLAYTKRKAEEAKEA